MHRPIQRPRSTPRPDRYHVNIKTMGVRGMIDVGKGDDEWLLRFICMINKVDLCKLGFLSLASPLRSVQHVEWETYDITYQPSTCLPVLTAYRVLRPSKNANASRMRQRQPRASQKRTKWPRTSSA
jgi:hypothetical protein